MANFASCDSSPDFDFQASQENYQGQEFTSELFIEEVTSRPIIWNSSLTADKDSRQKEVAWEQLAKVFQKNGEFSSKFSAFWNSTPSHIGIR